MHREELRSFEQKLVACGDYETLAAELDSLRTTYYDRQRAEQEAIRARNLAVIERRQAERDAAAVEMRENVQIGTRTNCGVVFEIRLPLVGVQTSVGAQFIELDRLYAPGAGCLFSGEQYVGPDRISAF